MDDLMDSINMIKARTLKKQNNLEQMMLQAPPPWSDLQKIEFQVMVELLMKQKDRWDEELERIKTRIDRLPNQDANKENLKQELRLFKTNEGNEEMLEKLEYQISKLQKLLDTKSLDSHYGSSGNVSNVSRARSDEGSLGEELIQLGSDDGKHFVRSMAVKKHIPEYITTPIPALNIAKFEGDYMEWDGFWERFKYAVHDRAYPDVEKLYALMNLLGGRAKEAVAGIRLCSENYDTVLNILIDRFGRKELIVSNLQMKLRNIQPASPNPDSIRMVVDSVHNICRQLENNGVDINNEPTKMDIISKFPNDEGRELFRYKAKNNATTEQLLKKMQEISFCAEIMPRGGQSSRLLQPLKPFKIFDRNDTTQRMNKSDTRDMKQSCLFCDGHHKPSTCSSFASPEEKVKQLMNKKRCVSCMGKDHYSTNCPRKDLVCVYCKNSHLSFLCQRSIAPKKTNVMLSVNKNGALLAKKVLIAKPDGGKTAEAIIFFDSGSQRSYIKYDLIKRLDLPIANKEVLNVNGFGGKKSRYKSELAHMKIKSIDGWKELFANSTRNIVDRISIIEKKDDELQQIHVEPDILIGMDYFWEFIIDSKRKNDLHIINSIVGQMYSGKVLTKCCDTVSSIALDSTSDGLANEFESVHGVVCLDYRENPEKSIDNEKKEEAVRQNEQTFMKQDDLKEIQMQSVIYGDVHGPNDDADDQNTAVGYDLVDSCYCKWKLWSEKCIDMVRDKTAAGGECLVDRCYDQRRIIYGWTFKKPIIEENILIYDPGVWNAIKSANKIRATEEEAFVTAEQP